jgi:hypothetical protein
MRIPEADATGYGVRGPVMASTSGARLRFQVLFREVVAALPATKATGLCRVAEHLLLAASRAAALAPDNRADDGHVQRVH